MGTVSRINARHIIISLIILISAVLFVGFFFWLQSLSFSHPFLFQSILYSLHFVLFALIVLVSIKFGDN